jgi:hypothetical protein
MVESCKNACPGSVLEEGFASESTADRCAQVEEHTAEPHTAGEGEGGMGGQAGRQAHCRVQGNTGSFCPPQSCHVMVSAVGPS